MDIIIGLFMDPEQKRDNTTSMRLEYVTDVLIPEVCIILLLSIYYLYFFFALHNCEYIIIYLFPYRQAYVRFVMEVEGVHRHIAEKMLHNWTEQAVNTLINYSKRINN